MYTSYFSFFQDGLKTIEHFHSYIDALVTKLSVVRQRQDTERRKLCELREALKSTMTTYKEVMNAS